MKGFLVTCTGAILYVSLLFSSFQTLGQDTTRGPSFSAGVDLMSRYIWRGTDYGNAPGIQPNLALTWKGFELGVWGSYGFGKYSTKINDSTIIENGNYAEFDPYLSYTARYFSICFTDYFFPNSLNPNLNNKYFNYKSGNTGHLLEGMLCLQGPAKFPLKLMAATMFYGNDKKQKISGTDTSMVSNYSTYLELSYPFNVKSVDATIFLGATPGKGIYMMDGSDGFQVVNLGLTVSKTIPITEKFGLPVSASIITNPQAESVFLVFGISL